MSEKFIVQYSIGNSDSPNVRNEFESAVIEAQRAGAVVIGLTYSSYVIEADTLTQSRIAQSAARLRLKIKQPAY